MASLLEAARQIIKDNPRGMTPLELRRKLKKHGSDLGIIKTLKQMRSDGEFIMEKGTNTIFPSN